MKTTNKPKLRPEELAALGLKPEDLQVTAYDVNDYLNTDEEVAGYLSTALAMGGLPLLLKALRDLARRPTDLARQAGLTDEHLAEALAKGGNPRFATVLRVAQALGLRLQFVVVKEEPPAD